MKLQKLISCHIYRDGGSLKGTWLTDNNTECVIFLKVQPWETVEDLKNKKYYFTCAGMNYIGKFESVSKNSPLFYQLINMVEEWLVDNNLKMEDLGYEQYGSMHELITELRRANF